MRLIILDSAAEVAEWAAKYVMKRINEFQPNEKKYFVLGLPTGRPIIFFKFFVILFLLKQAVRHTECIRN